MYAHRFFCSGAFTGVLRVFESFLRLFRYQTRFFGRDAFLKLPSSGLWPSVVGHVFDLSLAYVLGQLPDTSVSDSFDASASDSPKLFILAAPLLAQVHLVSIFATHEDMFCAYQEWILIDSTEVDLRWTQA